MCLSTLLCSWPCLFWFPPSLFWDASPSRSAKLAVLLVGVGFISFQYTRSKAFQLSRDTSVVNLLYLEIALCFLLQAAVLHVRITLTSGAGALLIFAGCIAVGALKSSEARRSTKQQSNGMATPRAVWQIGGAVDAAPPGGANANAAAL